MKENEDAIYWSENERFCVAALADGVSTCTGAKVGAEIACKSIVDLQLRKGEKFFDFSPNKTADFLVSHVLHELEQEALRENRPIEEYSSTISSVLIDKETGKVLFFNIGDNLILGTKKEKCNVIAMPENNPNGCSVTTTENVLQSVEIGIMDAKGLDSVVICSDGAWRQMYEKNRLYAEVAEALSTQHYDTLETYLDKKEGLDDSSFISLKLKDIVGGKYYER